MKKHIFLALIITSTIIGCNKTKSPLITIDTHIDINVENFTDSINYTMNTDTKFNHLFYCIF